MFYTNQSIRLHSKCLEILEMLQKIGNRIEENKRSIKLWESRDSFPLTNKKWFIERLEINEKIRERLAFYYFDILNKTMQQGCREFKRQLETKN